MNIIILGAAGRDFHNFNTYFRDKEQYHVVAFTANQIPDIHGRKYPPHLAGILYPKGIPIYEQSELPHLIRELKADMCVFAYSDVSYQYVMDIASTVHANGASFMLLGPGDTQLKSSKPVISVCAVRTGCGKSQTSRRVIELLMRAGLKVVAIRHPMPYGDLNAQKIQRFASIEDLDKHKCSIEEREEYEPHVVRGNVIYAGVDYECILEDAEKDPGGCDVIVWDGGNNDFPFIKTDLMITVVDPHRPGHELRYYPSEVNLRLADVVVINKMDTARPEDIQEVRKNIFSINPKATVVDAASPIHVDQPDLIRGQRVLIIEDGPTLTHGEMAIGAGVIAARKYGASAIVDPRPFVVGSLTETLDKYPHIQKVLPAMGYDSGQIRDLEATIENTVCDTVIIATPIDLSRIMKISKPCTRVYYDLRAIGLPNLEQLINQFLRKRANYSHKQ